MKIRDIIKTAHQKTVRALANGYSPSFWRATMFGLDFTAESKQAAEKLAVAEWAKQGAYQNVHAYRWAPSGALFHLYYDFGWVYTIVRPGSKNSCLTRMATESHANALIQMEKHCAKHLG